MRWRAEANLNTHHLTALMARFPQLDMLRLECMRHFDALTFLEPVRDTLRFLSLLFCSGPELAPASLLSLHSFRLTHLELFESFTPRPDALHRFFLTPPSKLLPVLDQLVMG